MQEADFFENEAIELILNSVEHENPGIKLCDDISKLIREISRLKNGKYREPSNVKSWGECSNFYENVTLKKLQIQNDAKFTSTTHEKAFAQPNDCECNLCLELKEDQPRFSLCDEESQFDVVKKGDILQLKDGHQGVYLHLACRRQTSIHYTIPVSMGVTVLMEGKEHYYPMSDILHRISPKERKPSYNPNMNFSDELTSSKFNKYQQWLLPSGPNLKATSDIAKNQLHSQRGPFPRRHSDSIFRAGQYCSPRDSVHSTDSTDSGLALENTNGVLSMRRRESLV